MTTETRTFKILPWHLTALEDRLAKLARRGKRLAKKGFEVNTEFRLTSKALVPLKEKCVETGATEMWHVTVEGPAPRVEGWEVLALVDHAAMSTRNAVHAYDDSAVDVAALATAEPTCDHCGHNRRRNKTAVVRERETGRTLRVGMSCLRDFVSDVGAEYMAWVVEGWAEAEIAPESESEGGGAGAAQWFSLVNVVALALDAGPFVSASQAEMYGRTPTSGEVRRALAANVKPTAGSKAQAQVYVEKAAEIWSQDEGSGYEITLATLCAERACQWKMIGYAASLPSAVDRHEAKVAREKAQAERAGVSRYVGTLGKREAFEATVERVYAHEGYYGTTHFVTLRTDEGNVLCWPSSRNPKHLDKGAFEAGDRIAFKATVKAHDTFRDERQTKVSRLTVTRCDKADKAA